MAATETMTIRLERKRMAALRRSAKRAGKPPATHIREKLTEWADMMIAADKVPVKAAIEAEQEGKAAYWTTRPS